MAACVFCGRDADLTDEHVWPDWLRKHLPYPGVSDRTAARMARVPGSAMRRAVDVRQWKAKERKLPLLCLSCNNHWLSDIESRTSPILAPLIRGEPAALTERDQARLALWAVKTTVLLQFTMAPDQQGVPQAHFDYLYQRRAIPPHVWVWIASYDGEPYNTIFGWQRLSPEVALDAGTTVAAAYASTIGVHKVVLEVTGGLFPARSKPYEIGLKDPSQTPIRQLWPVTRDPLNFPTGAPSIGVIDQLEAIARRDRSREIA